MEMLDVRMPHEDEIELESLTPHEIPSEEEKESTSSMAMALMNFINSIVGAGVVGQPYAFKNCGVLAGTILLIILAFTIDWTLRLIVVNSKLSGKRTFQDTAFHCFGNPGRWIMLIAQASFAYGGAMAFCVIIGDSVPHVLKSLFGTSNKFLAFVFSRNVVIVLCTACVSFPLSLHKDISNLAKASAFAIFGMTFIIGIVVLRGWFLPMDLKGVLYTSDFLIKGNLFQGISVISFALVCHHNTLFIYRSMERPTLERFSKLTHMACVVSVFACGLLGISGFLTFRSNTKGNVLNNFPPNDLAANFARLFFGLNMLTTFPLEIFVVRDVISEFLVKDGGELSRKAHFGITSFLVFSSMSVSLFTCNLGIILELVGATSASIMAFVMPPACFIALLQPEEKTLMQRVRCYGCMGFGIIVMVVSSTLTVLSAVKGGNENHCVE